MLRVRRRGESLTEDELIAAISRAIADGEGSRPRAPLVLGIGDDAAAWRPSRSNLSVITTDALVDGVHFLRDAMSAESIGVRAMASNISDVAAMGARPRLATIALGMPIDVDEAWIVAAYRGLATTAARYGARIAGGDIVRAPSIVLAITVVGEVSATNLKRRDGGRAGDVLAVTRPLGASRAGLELVRRPDLNALVNADSRNSALAAFERPEPEVCEGRFFGASRNVHAMMDVSDGLSIDVARLARASGCGAVIDDVPVDSAAATVAGACGDDPKTYALAGGEDFTLLVAIAPRAFDHLATRFRARFGRSLLRIGSLDDRPGIRQRIAGSEQSLTIAGFDHLATTGRG